MIHYQNQEDYMCALTYYETDSFFGFFFWIYQHIVMLMVESNDFNSIY